MWSFVAQKQLIDISVEIRLALTEETDASSSGHLWGACIVDQRGVGGHCWRDKFAALSGLLSGGGAYLRRKQVVYTADRLLHDSSDFRCPPLRKSGWRGPRRLSAGSMKSIYDKRSGSITITTHLDRISHCETASGTNWSNRWTYRVLIMNTRRD